MGKADILPLPGAGAKTVAETTTTPAKITAPAPAHGLGNGRLVDLVKPDPRAQVAPAGYLHAAFRSLAMPWAWQHVTGDVDAYDVAVPPAQPPPAGWVPCIDGDEVLDGDGSLALSAFG